MLFDKKVFAEPICEVISLKVEDVVTASSYETEDI